MSKKVEVTCPKCHRSRVVTEKGKNWSKLDGGETRAARLAFAGGGFTLPLTKGMLRPFGNPSAMPDSSPPQAVGHSQASS